MADTTPNSRVYRSDLTRAEFDAIVSIEKMMSEGCAGMYPADGVMSEELAESMYDRGLLDCAEMDAHEELGSETDDGRVAYWPTSSGRFLRGMCVSGRRFEHEVVFADDAARAALSAFADRSCTAEMLGMVLKLGFVHGLRRAAGEPSL